jgi:hypothetical protein
MRSSYSTYTTFNVLPKGARSFKMVSICGLVLPVSIRAITGWLTPLFSSRSFNAARPVEENSFFFSLVHLQI